ncbi:LysR substrate-binding domain-containing protein [Plesiomonas shigelloides subsp. oncorhynchi]|nr:LysR substrate-binding domain-containing protein [Plesiomonas shigelloides]
MLRYAENILQQENNLHIELNDISEEITGILKVGLPPIIGAVYFPEILFTFRKRCPKVELEIVEMPTPQLEDALHSGAIEIAAAMLPMHAEGYKIKICHRLFGDGRSTSASIKSEKSCLYYGARPRAFYPVCRAV